MRLPKEIIVPGFRAAGTHCGIKRSGAPDLALVVSDRPCVSAAVFTRLYQTAIHPGALGDRPLPVVVAGA